MSRSGRIAALLALAALNGVAVWTGLRGYDAWDSRRWTEAQGRVVASSARIDGEGWQAVVEYEYDAGGRTRRSTVMTFDGPEGGMRYDTRAVAERVVGAYPVGRPVKVFYDPAIPERAVLERAGAFRLVGLAAFFASVVGLTDLLVAAWVWHSRRHAG